MMHQKVSRIVFQIILTITLFSLWAGFALLVVNKYFFQELPGYTIGRICIWEFVACLVAGVIAQLMIKKWGNIEVLRQGEKKKILLNTKFGLYFTLYVLLVVLVGLWQFWMFSQEF